MLHLLTHHALFAPLANGAHLQLSGVAITAAAKALSPYGPQPPPAPAAPPSAPRARRGRAEEDARAASARRRRRRGPPSPDMQGEGPPVGDDGGEAHGAWDAEAPSMHSSAPSQRPLRPSSWQRRRAARAALGLAAGDTASQPPDSMPPPGPSSDKPKRLAARHKASVGACLSLVLLNSPALFYCAAFPRKAGFGKQHLLRRAGSGARGARRLWLSIWGQAPIRPPPAIPAALPVAMARPPPPPLPQPRRVAREWRHLLVPLRALLRRAQRCPFRALLEAHCPLPPSLRASSRVRPSAVRGGAAARPVVRAASPAAMFEEEEQDSDDGYVTQEDGVQYTSSARLTSALGGAPPPTQAQLLASHTPAQAAASFVWAVIRRIVPYQLLGGKAGCSALRRLVCRLCCLRRRDPLTLHAAMQRLPTRAWKALRPHGCAPAHESPASGAAQSRRVAKLVRWLVGTLALPLLRSHFYVTEGEATSGRVFFYRKPVWARLRAQALKGALRDSYAPVPLRRAAQLLRTRTLGFASLRLLPKRSGVLRPIANLGREQVLRAPTPRSRLRGLGLGVAARAAPLRFKSVNAELAPALAALRSETARQPALLGASVFDYTNLYKRLAPFIRSLRIHPAQPDADDAATPLALRQRVYVVAVDISRAFDTLPLPALSALAERLLGAPQYSVLRYSSVTPAHGGRLHTRWGKVAAAVGPGAQAAAPPLAEAVCLDRPVAPRAVLVDGATQQRVGRLELVRRLRELLGGTLVRLGGAFLLQHTGVAQGSVLSSLLCSAFYADMEHQHGLAGGAAAAAREECQLLLRWVDDFLFLSTDPQAASRFVQALSAGFPEYGAAVSVAKTCLNFDAWVAGKRLPRNEHAAPCGARYVRWCGLLLNSDTLELQADYTRLAGESLRDVVALGREGRGPGAALAARVRAFLRPKAAALLFDASLNGAATAALNCHQCFLLAAAKLHAYAGGCLAPPRLQLLMEVINDALRYGRRLLCVRLAAAPGAPPPHRALRGSALRFLALTAFERVLGRKQSRYGPLVAWLRKELRSRTLRAAARRPALAYAVHPSRSESLTHIRF